MQIMSNYSKADIFFRFVILKYSFIVLNFAFKSAENQITRHNTYSAEECSLGITGVFNDAVKLPDWTIMNWKGCERKLLWPNLISYTCICLEMLRKTNNYLSGE
jgi:hypothetical protein